MKQDHPITAKNPARGLTVLGIESSCDETAAAIVSAGRIIHAQALVSQKDHEAYGGVVPEVAARAHLRHLDGQVRRVMQESGMTFGELDALAVTAGPGLIGGVLVGALTAKAIASVHRLPIVGVNHLEGHALTARLTNDVAFPFLLLLVSGGHCQILLVRGVGDYTRLGATVDDAVGEAFDKTAKLMSLGYPGGPALERQARACPDPAAAARRFPLPRPFAGQDNCDFSFSGLKTAVRRLIDGLDGDTIDPETAADIAASFQAAVADILCDRMGKALARVRQNTHTPVTTVVVAGGVAANLFLRARLEAEAQRHNCALVAPPVGLCTDNAAMIAWAGIERLSAFGADSPDFPLRARWPLDPEAVFTSPKSQRT